MDKKNERLIQERIGAEKCRLEKAVLMLEEVESVQVLGSTDKTFTGSGKA